MEAPMKSQLDQGLGAILQVRPADGGSDGVPGGLVCCGRQHLAELRAADGDTGRAAVHSLEHQQQQQHWVRPLVRLLIS
jgi:hypothetical protein